MALRRTGGTFLGATTFRNPVSAVPSPSYYLFARCDPARARSKRRKREEKSGSHSEHGFDPHRATSLFDNSLADGQADSRTGIFVACVEPLKDREDAVKVLRLD